MNAVEILATLDSIGFKVIQFLLSILWQSSIIILAAMVLSRILRKQRSSIRHTLWVCIIFAVPLIPLLALIFSSIGTPQAPIPVIPKYSEPAFEISYLDTVEESDTKNTLPLVSVPADEFQTSETEILPQENTVESESRLNILNYPWAIIFALYVLGASFFLIMILAGRLRIKRWIAESNVITDSKILGIFEIAADKVEFSGDYIVVENNTIESPVTAGTFHPVIMLPADFTDHFEPSEMYSIALHELSHVRRKDTLTLSLVLIIRALFFFHPLIWAASRYVSLLAENSCDYAVIETTGEPLQYAKMLAGIAEKLPNRSIGNELAVGIIFSKSAFLRRVEAILSHRNDHIRRISRVLLAATGASVIMAIVLALSFPLGEIGEKGEMITVSGEVVYDGKPVPNADIYLYKSDITFEETTSAEKMTSSHRNGSFTFNVDSSKLPAGILVCGTEYPVKNHPLHENMDFSGISIELEKSETIFGMVSDNDGVPIKGAVVTVQELMILSDFKVVSNLRLKNGIPGMTSTTDSEGKFTIENVSENTASLLKVNAKGYAAKSGFGMQAGRSGSVITLEPEGRIEGLVIYGDTGKPASNIPVTAVNINGRESSSAKTDRNGQFILANLKSGEHIVKIEVDEKFNEWTAGYVDNLNVKSGETIGGVKLELVKGGIINGRATEEKTGVPIRGMRVYSFGPQWMGNIVLGSDMTDNNGEYSIRSFPGNANLRMYTPAGYYREYKSETIQVVEGQTVSGVDVEFQKGVSITGKVIDPDGQPLGGVVIADTMNSKYRAWQGRVISNDDGTFVLTGVTAGFEISLEAREIKKQLRGFFEKRVSPENEIEIRLERYELASIEGRVFGLSGDPLRGIPIELYKENRDGSGGRAINAATTDSTGYYRIADIIVGDDYSLYAKFEGSEDIYIGVDNLVPGLNALGDTVQPLADRWLEGTVTDSDGKPVSGAMVMVNAMPTGFQHINTDESGYYRLDNLIPKVESAVGIIHNDYGTYFFNNIVTNEEHNFTVQVPKYHLSGIVLDKDGNPLDTSDDRFIKVMVSIDPNMHESGRHYNTMQVGDNGKFTLENILDPVIKLRFIYNNDVYTFENVATNRDNVEFILGEMGGIGEKVTVSGNVVYEGTPVPNADIYLYSNSGTPSNNIVANTKRNGSFSFSIDKAKIDDGNNLRVIAYNPQYSLGSKLLSLFTEHKDSTFVLRDSAPISGFLRNENGAPIEDAEITALQVEADMFYTVDHPLLITLPSFIILNPDGSLPCYTVKSDRDGYFQLNNLPENAAVSLSIVATGYAEIFRDLILQSGTSNSVLTLKPEGRIEGIARYENSRDNIELRLTGGSLYYPVSKIIKTDKDGRYSFGNLKPGKYSLAVRTSDEYPEWTKVNIPDVQVSEGETVTLSDLTFDSPDAASPKAFVSGTITNNDTNEKMSGISVSAKNADDGYEIGRSVTDENGHYILEIHPGKMVITAYTKKEIYPDGRGSIGPVNKNIEVSEGETKTGVDFAYTVIDNRNEATDTELTVKVIDSQSNPVERAYVFATLTPEGELFPTYMQAQETDKTGITVFTGLEEGMIINIQAEHLQKKLKGQSKFTVTNNLNPTIRMEQYRTVDVKSRIVNKRGEPVAGAGISVQIESEELARNNGINMYNVITDGRGEFSVNDLIIGENYVFNISAEGYEQSQVSLAPLAEDSLPLGDIVLVEVKSDNNIKTGSIENVPAEETDRPGTFQPGSPEARTAEMDSVPLGEIGGRGETATFSGTVVYEGEAVSGADIYISDSSGTFIEFIKSEKAATSEGEGSFAFKAKNIQFPTDMIVFTPDYAANWIKLSDNAVAEDLRIELGRHTSVSGHVFDTSGAPINGAIVKVIGMMRGVDYTSSCYFGEGIPKLTEKTGADGNFLIGNLPENTQVLISVRASGYEKVFKTGITAGMSGVDFSLAPEGRIDGRILYGDTGKPAEGVTVYARNKNIKMPNSDLVTTDRDGRFTMTNLPPGLFFVFLPPVDDFTEWTARYVENIEVESGKVTNDVELNLIKGGIITGKVTDRDTGEPLSGLQVASIGDDSRQNTPFAYGRTDENGVYRIRFYPGKTEIRTYPPSGYLSDIQRETVQVDAGETVSGVDFAFGRGLSVNGRVYGPGGEPYGNIVISNTEGLSSQSWRGSVRSQDDGTFTLHGVHAGDELSLVAEDKDKQLRGYFAGTANSQDNIEIRLESSKSAGVEGRILDEQGNPFFDVGLMLHVVDYDGGGSRAFKAATTDASGHYTISNLIAGDRYRLIAEADGYAEKDLGISVLDSGVTHIRDASLEIASRWIEGLVTTNSGNAVEGARVSVNGGPSGYKYSITDKRGFYRIENLVPETERRVGIHRKDIGMLEFNDVPTNTVRNFEIFIPENHLSGIVLDMNGVPIHEAYVTIDPQRHESGAIYGGVLTDSGGKFRIDNIIDSQVNLRISSDIGYLNFENVETNRDNVEFILKPPVSDDGKASQFIPGSPEAQVAEMDSVLNFTDEQKEYVLKMLKSNPQANVFPGSPGNSSMEDKMLTPLTPEHENQWRAYETDKRINRKIISIDNAVKLTEEQKKQIMPVVRKEDENMQAFNESYVPTTEDVIRDKLFAIRNETYTALESILNEEQMKIFNERLRKER